MFRIRLPSGEEAVYRSVDELALAIQSGVITTSAEVFHGKSQQWLPITNHPEYGVALGRAPTLLAVEETAPPVPAEPVSGGPPQVYQMFSRSAKELADRRRPRWHAQAALSAAGLVVVAATALTLLPNPQITDEAVLPAGVSRDAPSAPGASPADPSDQARRILAAPYNLANRFGRAKQEAAATLAGSASRLALAGALRTARLGSTDSLRQGLLGLTALRPLIEHYRTELRELHKAYQDTAANTIRAGLWSRSDGQEWRARTFWPEPAAAAARADTLLDVLVRLHTFLLAEPNRINLAAGGFIPGSDSAAATYDRLRSTLTRLRTLTLDQQSRAGAPLRLLLSLLGSDTLPARRGT